MSTQFATRQTLITLLEKDQTQTQLAMALPRYYTPEKFISIVRTAINKTPKLAECDPGSFMVSMVTSAQMGILPDGRNGHLIPRWNGKTQRLECTFQPDYKGKVALIRRSEGVADIYAETVRSNDVFKITAGLHRDIIHEFDHLSPRGDLVGVYAVIQYKDQSLPPSWCFMPREEVESVRERSESWRAHKDKGYSTPWLTDEGEMWKKTAINRLAKMADLSPETLDRLEADPELRIVRSANATEIPRAQIPDIPTKNALPETTEENPPIEDSKQDTEEEESKPEKPARTKKALKSQKPKEEPKDTSEKNAVEAKGSAEAETIKAKLKEGGFDERHLIAICAREKWCEEGCSINDIPEASLKLLTEYWDDEIIPALKEEAGQ